MSIGDTTTSSLTDSLDNVRASARIVREQQMGITGLVDRVTLSENTGLTWQEISWDQLTAQRVTETTTLDNPQQFVDNLLGVTPTLIGIHTFVTDRVAARINKIALGKMGSLAQNAIERMKDQDGLTTMATGATTCSPAAGNVLTMGHISSAKANISSNTTEPNFVGPFYGVFHGFQIVDIFDQMVAGVGTYVVNEGPTAKTMMSGFDMPVAGVKIYENGNITINSSDDAVGGVFAKDGIILVQGMAAKIKAVRKEDKGGGGTAIYHYDEYAYGLRSSTRWVQSLTSDATAPTS